MQIKIHSFILYAILCVPLASVSQDADVIMKKVDLNMASTSRIMESKMTIYGKRNERTIVSKTYAVGSESALTEYLQPEREKGTKMLKLEDRLWIYNPSTDRTIQLSGHMLRQSVMGSDLSYEDMMEDREMMEIYNASLIGEEEVEERSAWIIELSAKVADVSYERRKIWIDQERFVPLREELYAKSGSLLKSTTFSNIQKVDGRWYPLKMLYKDELKNGKGTTFELVSIDFNAEIPPHVLSKAALK